MTVYVDSPYQKYGRMRMCHMIADTSAELLSMARCIGVKRKWLQYEGEYKEHFDVCKSKRTLAVSAGAVELTNRDFIRKLMERR